MFGTLKRGRRSLLIVGRIFQVHFNNRLSVPEKYWSRAAGGRKKRSRKTQVVVHSTFCCSLPENMLSLTSTSNSLIQKYIHFIQLTFISVDTRQFGSKGVL